MGVFKLCRVQLDMSVLATLPASRPANGTGAWTLAAVVVGVVLALPILVLAGSLFEPGGEAWAHLAATVLPGYVRTTLLLLVLVLAGVACVGVGAAWLIAA